MILRLRLTPTIYAQHLAENRHIKWKSVHPCVDLMFGITEYANKRHKRAKRILGQNVMSRIFTALPLLAVLAACDNANPFMLEVTQDPADTEGVVEGDPNVDVNNRYAYDLGQRLTMNSVDVDDNGTPGDTSDDVLVINNLPFDGPD